MKNYLLGIINNRYFLLLVGIMTLIYIIYIRVIMERMPKYFTNDNSIYLILSFNMSILFIILLIIRIYIYYRLKHPKNIVNNSIIKNFIISISSFFSTIVLNGLYTLDYKIKDIVPFSGNVVEYFARLILTIEKVPKKILILIYTIELIVPIIFIIEIVVFKQLETFYRVLMLLLFPLLMKYGIYSLRIWCTDQENSLNECVYIELTDYIDKYVTPRVFTSFFCITDDDPININVHYVSSYKHYRVSQNMPIEEGLVEIGNFLFLVSETLFYLLIYQKKMSLYNESIYPIINTTLYAIGWIYLFISLYIS